MLASPVAISEYLLAPPAPVLKRSLPLAQRLNGGVWLPDNLAEGLHLYLAELSLYPQQCQVAMDVEASVLRVQSEEQRRVDAAQAQHDSDKRAAKLQSNQWSWPKVIAIAVGAAAVGFVAAEIETHR